MGGMTLTALLEHVAVNAFRGGRDPVVSSLHYDSRTVRPGGLFVAIKGLKENGNDYVADAVARGAVAVVTENEATAPSGTTIIRVENARSALAALSAAYYGHPSRELFVIGITGTNGKTTTAYLIESILGSAGYAVGVVGTVNTRFAGKVFNSAVTTPESLDLMRVMRQMLDKGVTHVIVEVSSHALDLGRVSECEFDIGVFTNLSRDHLDYHGDMAAYWQSKKRLFTRYLGSGAKRSQAVAVVNSDDPKGRELVDRVPVACTRTGIFEPADIQGLNIRTDLGGTEGRVRTPQGTFDFSTPLIGRHNVYNILAATGVASAMGVSVTAIKAGIEALKGVPGRLESVENDAGITVFVDYAHTPDALENILRTVKDLAIGRLICVFGCGGDRDREKRPMMGTVAGRLSDLVVLTNDNPRSERPEAILKDIEAGVVRVQREKLDPEAITKEKQWDRPGYTVEPDRRRAIALAIAVARPGDTVVIAGKGHETYQLIGSETLSFDDRVEVQRALQELSARDKG
ncbi:MAG: UDP-N-acetylmuramoyl-L-alanyl-D-glutamate--2,6-diaminopimelate ligase [Deltaproteobacteria bacterium]|nr:UDP-N-acetylmuramoyl-L-alanyl-D-glutamate--2,6-diaminopimelate ligase [Deltaproteobacteria bacterium]